MTVIHLILAFLISFSKCSSILYDSSPLKHGTKHSPNDVTYTVSASESQACTDDNQCPTLALAVEKEDVTTVTIASDLQTDSVKCTISKSLSVSSETPAHTLTLSGSDIILTISENTVSFSTLNIILSSETGAVLSANVFSVESDATLKLTSMTFTGSATEKTPNGAAITAEVIASEGTLELEGCTFQYITLSDKPLLALNTEPDAFVIPSTSTFTSITRETGCGAVIEETLQQPTVEADDTVSTSLSIKNAKFQGCSSEMGVIAFTIETDTESDAFSIESTVSFKDADGNDITYDSASTCAVGFIVAEAALLKQTGKFDVTAILTDYETDEKKYYVKIGTAAAVTLTAALTSDDHQTENPEDDGTETTTENPEGGDPTGGDDDNPQPTPSIPTDGKFTVSPTGTDSENCGKSETPCATVTRAAENGAEEVTIAAQKEEESAYSAAKIALVITKDITIQGETATGCKVNVDSANVYQIADGASTVTIKNMIVTLTTASSSFLASLSAGTVTLDSISFSSAAGTTLSSPVLMNQAGTLILNAVTASSITLEAPFLVSSSTVTIQGNSQFTSITNTATESSSSSSSHVNEKYIDGSVLSTLGKLTTIKNTKFTSCKCTGGDGGAIAVSFSQASSSLILSSVEFSSCSSLSGNGGALAIQVTSSSSLSFTSVLFSSCSAATSGGAVAISASAPFSSVTMSSVTYQSNTVGEEGIAKCLMYASSASTADLDEDSSIPASLTAGQTPDDTSFLYMNSVEGDAKPEIGNLFDLVSSNYIVDASVKGTECKDTSCPSIATAIAAAKEAKVQEPTIIIAYSTTSYTTEKIAATIDVPLSIIGQKEQESNEEVEEEEEEEPVVDGDDDGEAEAAEQDGDPETAEEEEEGEGEEEGEQTVGDDDDDDYRPLPTIAQTASCFVITKDITANQKVSISDLTVTLTTSGTFVNTAALGTVEITRITFSSSTYISFTTIDKSLIVATAGTVNMNKVKAMYIKVSSGPLISISEGTSFSDADSIYANIQGRGVVNANVAKQTVKIDGCMYTECKSEGDGGAVSITTTTISTGTITLSDLSFESCTAAGNGGGCCIILNKEATLSLSSHFSFEKCSGVNGGGLYIASSSSEISTEFEDISFSFTKCAASGSGGGLYLSISSTSSFSLSGSSPEDSDYNIEFTSCTAEEDGGGVCFSFTATHQSSSPSLHILSSSISFSKCKAGRNGGAVAYTQTSNGYLVTTGEDVSIIAKSCSAESYGGFAYFNIQNEQAPIVGADHSYSGTFTASQGKYVYIATTKEVHTTVDSESLSIADWRPLFAEYADIAIIDNTFIMVYSAKTTQLIELATTVTLAVEGTDCTKEESTTCTTLLNAVTLPLNEGGVLVVKSGTHKAEETGTTIEAPTIIKGEDKSSSVLKLSQKGTITIGTSYETSVAIKSLTILLEEAANSGSTFIQVADSLSLVSAVLHSNNVALSTPVITVVGGLLLEEASFINTNVAKVPLIDIQSGTSSKVSSVLIRSSSLFENITSTQISGSVFSIADTVTHYQLVIESATFTQCTSGGDGGAISIVLGTASVFSLSSDVLFNNCAAADEKNGGAISMTISDSFTPSSSSSSSFSIDSVTFTDCTAKKGTNIYATVTSSLYATFSTLKYWIYLTPTADNQFIVTNGGEGASDTVDLNGKKPTAVLIGSSSTSEGEECGLNAENPCPSLETALDSFYSVIEKIEIVAGATLKQASTLTISRTVSISSQSTEEGETKKTTKIATTLQSSETVFTITSLQEGDENYDDDDDAEITVGFKDVQFALTSSSSSHRNGYDDAGIDYGALFTVSSASLSLDSVTCTSASTTTPLSISTSLIDSSSGHLSLTSCDFTSITLTASPLLSVQPGELEMEGTNHFTSITLTGDEDEDEPASGSVFSFLLNDGESLTISNAVFDKCISKTGSGGAIFALLAEGASLNLTRVNFTECTAITDTSAQTESKKNEEKEATQVGGAVCILLQGMPKELVLKSIHCTKCKAQDGVGNAFFIGVPSADFFSSSSLWEAVSSVSSDDAADLAIYVVPPSTSFDSIFYDSESKKTLSEMNAHADDPEPGSWAWWKTTLLAIAGTVVVIGGFVASYFTCCKKDSSKVDPSSSSDSQETGAASNNNNNKSQEMQITVEEDNQPDDGN